MTEKERTDFHWRAFKLSTWLSNNYNLMFVGILILAFVIRLYLFYLTKDTIVWWDGAEYMLRAKAMVFDTPITGWRTSREIIFPLIIAGFLKLGFKEMSIRFLQILISTGTVAMLYITVQKVFKNGKMAIIASAFMTFAWLHLFFTTKILLYQWPCLIFLVVIYTFWRGYIDKENKYLWLCAIVSSIGMQIYFSTAFVIVGIFLFLLYKEGFKFFKNKKIWKALLIFILVLTPYMLYSQATFGFPIPRMVQGAEVLSHDKGAGLSGIFDYVKILPYRMGWVAISFAGLGLLFFIFELYIRRKLIFKHNNRVLDNYVLIFLCLLVPFAMYTWVAIASGFYDGFILGTFPLIFIFAASSMSKISDHLSKYNKIIGIVFVIILLGVSANYNYNMVKDTIIPRVDAYVPLRDAGLWLKDNTDINAIVYSTSVPQVTYFSERYGIRVPDTSELMDAEIISITQPSYYMVSIYERQHQKWLFSYADDHKLTPVYVSFLDEAKTKPAVIIYELKESIT